MVATIKLGTAGARKGVKKVKKRPAIKAKIEPDGAPTYVYLPRALEHVGQAMFGKGWSAELHGRVLPPPIAAWSDDEIDERQAEQVADIPREIAPDAVPVEDMNKEGLIFDTAWAEHPGLRKGARASRAEEIASSEAALQRLEQAQQMLCNAMRTGLVRTFTRSIRGGEFSQQASAFWNFEAWRERLHIGKVNRSNPYMKVDDWDCPATDYVFVSRVDLEFNFQLPSPKLPDLKWLWDKLSPRMRVALIAAEEVARLGKQPQSRQLEARLTHLSAIEGANLGQELAQNLSRIIRSKEAQSGVKGAHENWDETGATPLWQPYVRATK